MSRFYKNDFYYNSSGGRYRHKQAWTPENEEKFYASYGGRPYNPQDYDYSFNKFKRINRLTDGMMNPWDDPNYPQNPNDDGAQFRPMNDDIAIRVHNEPVRRKTELIEEVERPKIPKKRISLKVPSESVIRPFDASNRLVNQTKFVVKSNSGKHISINPRKADRVNVHVRRDRVRKAFKAPKLVAKNPISDEMRVENRNIENEINVISEKVMEKIRPELVRIEDRVGTQFKERDKIAEKNFNEFMNNNKIKADGLTRDDVLHMIYENVDPDALLREVKSMFGGKKIIRELPRDKHSIHFNFNFIFILFIAW